jgi:hypothetical protein
VSGRNENRPVKVPQKVLDMVQPFPDAAVRKKEQGRVTDVMRKIVAQNEGHVSLLELKKF